MSTPHAGGLGTVTFSDPLSGNADVEVMGQIYSQVPVVGQPAALGDQPTVLFHLRGSQRMPVAIHTREKVRREPRPILHHTFPSWDRQGGNEERTYELSGTDLVSLGQVVHPKPGVRWFRCSAPGLFVGYRNLDLKSEIYLATFPSGTLTDPIKLDGLIDTLVLRDGSMFAVVAVPNSRPSPTGYAFQLRKLSIPTGEEIWRAKEPGAAPDGWIPGVEPAWVTDDEIWVMVIGSGAWQGSAIDSYVYDRSSHASDQRYLRINAEDGILLGYYSVSHQRSTGWPSTDTLFYSAYPYLQLPVSFAPHCPFRYTGTAVN